VRLRQDGAVKFSWPWSRRSPLPEDAEQRRGAPRLDGGYTTGGPIPPDPPMEAGDDEDGSAQRP